MLVHGGMAQNVGPVLEMVTEKYLLRSDAEWTARQQTLKILEEILDGLKRGSVQTIGAATTRNFFGPIQTITPWATNFYTERLIEETRADLGADFWGFWMLGGMSGGGMGFIFAPEKKRVAQDRLQERMQRTRRELEHALPFAMEPVVYDFLINERSTCAELLRCDAALLPQGYYALIVPPLLRQELRALSPLRRAELDRFAAACRTKPDLRGMVQTLFDRLLPHLKDSDSGPGTLKDGRIGLAQNRLRPNADIQDVTPSDVTIFASFESDSPREQQQWRKLGEQSLARGEVGVVTLAAGAGSRWTQGAGVVKALHPFCKLGGRHRTFVETHLAKSRRTSRSSGTPVPHVFTTGYLTHIPIEEYLARERNYGYRGPLLLSSGQAIGLRLIPTVRDLRFAWEEMPQQVLDEQAQKMRDSLRAALISWAQHAGEASDYTDNVPVQCLHPVGHWYEVPNLFRNGTLLRLLEQRPQLKYLLLHNIDTVGANLEPTLLGAHIAQEACLSFEVIPRHVDDRGGGLARVNGRLRLLEGLAMPREEAEFALSYYNSLTTWIDIERLLAVFHLTRDALGDAEKVATAIRQLATRMPTYVTLKDVKKRWGHGQEDVFPVTQFEKLWGDMTTLPEMAGRFFVVPRLRGQQLKDQAQLDGWLRDGSASYVESLCDWG